MKKLIILSVIGLVFSCKEKNANENYQSDSLSVASGQGDSLSNSSSMNNTATPDSSTLNSSSTTPSDTVSTKRDSVRRRQ